MMNNTGRRTVIIEMVCVAGLLWLLFLVYQSADSQRTVLQRINIISSQIQKLPMKRRQEKVENQRDENGERKVIKIAFFVTAFGNYMNFTRDLIDSAKELLFMPKANSSVDDVSFSIDFKILWLLFTDREEEAPIDDEVRVIPRKRFGWPKDSMGRPELYLQYSEETLNKEEFDYYYSIDADNKFLNPVGGHILSDLVGTMHWMHFDKPFENLPFDDHKDMCAFVPREPGRVYYTAAFYGGRRQQVLDMWKWIVGCTNQYLEKKVSPSVEDESIVNKYFQDHPPTLILSPDFYNAHEGYGYWPGKRKIVFIDKDYAKARSMQSNP